MSANGKGFSNAAFTMLNRPVAAAIPIARETTAVTAKPGLRRKMRSAYRRSRARMSSKKVLRDERERTLPLRSDQPHDGLIERRLAAQRTCRPFDLGMARHERAFGSRQRAEGESSGEPHFASWNQLEGWLRKVEATADGGMMPCILTVAPDLLTLRLSET